MKKLVGAAAIGVIVLIIGLVLIFQPSHKTNLSVSKEKPTMTPDLTGGLQVTDEKVGTGEQAVTGKSVSVNYLGTLVDGTKFDSSYDRNQPFDFKLGGGQVIKGWDEGVVGMKVGGKRKLVIPANLGYGDQAVSTIPAGSILVFEIELLAVK